MADHARGRRAGGPRPRRGRVTSAGPRRQSISPHHTPRPSPPVCKVVVPFAPGCSEPTWRRVYRRPLPSRRRPRSKKAVFFAVGRGQHDLLRSFEAYLCGGSQTGCSASWRRSSLWTLGVVPAVLRHDNLSAATHELRHSGGRSTGSATAAFVSRGVIIELWLLTGLSSSVTPRLLMGL